MDDNMRRLYENGEVELKLKVYKRRWLILLLYILYAAGSTSQWVEYSIISNIVIRYYNVSSLAVDWTTMSYMALYALLIFPVSYLSDWIGLRWSTILGSGLSCLGAWIKVFSVAPDRFYVTFIGQAIVGTTQTLVLTAPGRLAAYWFDAEHLSTATSFAVFGNQLGIALGFLITPMIVKNHEQLDDIAGDFSKLFYGVAGYTTILFVLILILFQDEPEYPPSETRALQKINRSSSTEAGYLDSMKRLFRNQSFLILCNTYGLSIGVLNTVATLLNPMFLAHFENGEEDAGRIGLAIIITGMVGSVVLGIILDKTHKFKETTVTVYFLTFCGQVLFALALCFEIKWLVYVASVFLGFFISGYLALGYEMSAEYTYPESEETAMGILHVANNVYGIVFVLIMGKFLEEFGDVSAHISLCALLLVGFILTVLTKDEQRRQDARRTAQFQSVRITENMRSSSVS